MQERGLTPAQCFTGSALVDHILIDQLLHQDTDHSAGHIHATCQIGARNWLMFANKIKGDASIDIARGGAGSYVKILSVDLPHPSKPFVRSRDNMRNSEP